MNLNSRQCTKSYLRLIKTDNTCNTIEEERFPVEKYSITSRLNI